MEFERAYDWCGGSGQGDLKIPFSRLVEVLGEPEEGDGDKTDAEWCIRFKNGNYARIYNYKNGKNYNGEYGTETDQITDWRIGAKHKDIANDVKHLFDEYVDEDILSSVDNLFSSISELNSLFSCKIFPSISDMREFEWDGDDTCLSIHLEDECQVISFPDYHCAGSYVLASNCWGIYFILSKDKEV